MDFILFSYYIGQNKEDGKMGYKAIDVHVHVGNLNHWKPWVKDWWQKASPRDFTMIREDGSLDRDTFMNHLTLREMP